VHILNVLLGDLAYIRAVSRDKARQVDEITKAYVHDLADKHPQELWTVL